jgi:hypothetical protein
MSKYVITLDPKYNNDHKVEAVTRFPKNQRDDQIFCSDRLEALRWIDDLELSTIPADVRKKYDVLRKIVKEIS